MSFEEAIRERHAFEDRVKRFLEIASLMTDRELEVALGRLADMLQSDERQEHVQLRGDLLKAYFDLRGQKIKKQRSFKRAFQSADIFIPTVGYRKDNETDSDYLVRAVTTFALHSDKAISAPSPAQVPLIETVKLLSP